MIKNYEYYRKLVTSEYRHAPKYTETLKTVVNYGLDLDRAIDKIIEAFEIDKAGTDQLNKIGNVVGVARELNFAPSAAASGSIVCPAPEDMAPDDDFEKIFTPIPSKLKGVDILTGKSPYMMNDSDDGMIDDDVFRIMIKARIIQNFWKGTITELYELWDALFSTENKHLQIQDLQDMSYNIVLTGDFTPLERELITHAYIVPKPEGVRINIITFVSNEGLPLFSYKYNNAIYSGYGSHWVESEAV